MNLTVSRCADTAKEEIQLLLTAQSYWVLL